MTTRYYIAENRTYTGYDDTLQDRPVQLRLGQHPAGLGGAVPVPERPAGQLRGLRVQRQQHDHAPRCRSGAARRRSSDAHQFPSGTLLSNRRQPFDATFGQEATDAVTFHLNGVPVTVPSSAGIPTFDDTDPNRYWSSGNPRGSVKVAGTGTSMTVTNTRDGGNELQVHVAFAG